MKMIRRLMRWLKYYFTAELLSRVISLQDQHDALRVQLARLQILQMRATPPVSLHDAELQVFSQFGEDGIIQYLIQQTGPMPDTFVEFGVGNYTEANTLLLLLNNNWKGLILDDSTAAMEGVRTRSLYWRHDLTAVSTFIDRDNIDRLIRENGFSGEIGLLSIDIDGNDYWVWERMTVVEPVITVVEYNSTFGPTRSVAVPYDPGFQRTKAHFSNLYWGCSLQALCQLAARKGYTFVGSNSAGCNAFFIRKDRLGSLRASTAEEGYVASKFRDSRDQAGNLTFLSGIQRLQAIADLPLVDLESGKMIRVGDLP